MKNTLKFGFALLSTLLLFPSCTDKDDTLLPNDIRVYDFIWRGMNKYYLWQADAPNLADNAFANQDALNNFYRTYTDPTAFFNALRIDNGPIDRFSVIYSDYTVLQNLLQGESQTNGIKYGLNYKTGSSTDIFGWVKYVMPGTDAASKNIHRGMIFYAVDGVSLTVDNYTQLLGSSTYTMNFADYDNGNITPNGNSVSLTKSDYTENPVYMASVIPTSDGIHRIGYLVYNGFYSNYETQLNTAFGNLKNANITDLVLDLRYNPGGSIATATRLGSLITGQFNGQVFAKQQWNAKMQNEISQNNPNDLLNLFTNTTASGAALNSLSLSKVYILTSNKTASASELVINCLKPYITVVQIGDVTIGKNVGSITLYDSPTFGFTDVNPNHKYAMQPIVLKVTDKNNFGDYQAGLNPDYSLVEDLGNLSTLGNTNEPLLSAAISHIMAGNKMSPQIPSKVFQSFNPDSPENQMYLEKVPAGLHQ